ncbi:MULTISPECIES: diacylglycerol/lipid kinase family protein [Gracilibacillus]|uniref:diacylglycerol/lipid kinase family protein n=1 Tax=Gracilibacillus TaxID=74385 RepID=UPI000824D1B9|nr:MULTISPECIES: diacylglycerol kinase family protein [Gracilibacillus]
MKSAAVILNPNAGNGKLKKETDTIQARLAEVFEEVHLYITEQEGDGKKYVELLANNTDVIIGAGGDGTIFELVNAIAPLGQRPIFAILPGGTCNDFSRAIGMSQDPLLALEQIIQKHIKIVDIGYFKEYYFLNFLGIGLIAKVAEEMEDSNKKLLGKMSYYLNTSKIVFQNQPFHLHVKSEEQTYNGEAVMLVIGNGPFLGGMKSFFPHADMEDGKLDVLIMKETKFQQFWTWLEAQTQQDYPQDRDDQLIYFRTSQLQIETRPVQHIDSDGEILTETPTEVSVLPQHLQVLSGDE